jgi:hypothetical protein
VLYQLGLMIFLQEMVFVLIKKEVCTNGRMSGLGKCKAVVYMNEEHYI